MDKIIQLLEKLNSNIEKLLVNQSDELPTYTRKQTMNVLGVTTGTITNYERTYGNKFKLGKNAYSKRFVDSLKKAKNITRN